MIDVAEFLLARLADDQAAARESGADAMVGWRWKHYPPEAYEEVQALTLAHSARVLAECEAKRRIVERYQKIHGRTQDGDLDERLTLGWVLEQMALTYAGHPEFRDEWRP